MGKTEEAKLKIEQAELALKERETALKEKEFLLKEFDSKGQRIDKLLEVITYLNRIQDGHTTTTTEPFSVTVTESNKRLWNPHEEDIANAALIQLKRLIRDDD